MKHMLPVLVMFALQAAVPTTPMRAEGQASAPTEAEVRAQIILNLPLVADWPAGALPPDKRVTLCTLSESDVSHHLQAMASQQAYLENVLFVPRVSPQEIVNCRVLYVDALDKPRLGKVLAAVAKRPVLTVGDIRGFAKHGGMIGFLSTEKTIGLFSQKNVRFEINLTTTATAGITLDPLLLELAENLLSEEGR